MSSVHDLFNAMPALRSRVHVLVFALFLSTDRQPVGPRVDELLDGCQAKVQYGQAMDHLHTAAAVVSCSLKSTGMRFCYPKASGYILRLQRVMTA